MLIIDLGGEETDRAARKEDTGEKEGTPYVIMSQGASSYHWRAPGVEACCGTLESAVVNVPQNQPTESCECP